MSKRSLICFLLEELQTIRVLCRRQKDGQPCSGAVEVPLKKLGSILNCPACGEKLKISGSEDAYKELPAAIERLVKLSGEVGFELVFPDTGEAKKS